MAASHRPSLPMLPAAEQRQPAPGLRSAASVAWKVAPGPILIGVVVLVLLFWAALTIASDLVTVARVADMQLPKLELIQEAKYAELAASVALGESVMAQEPAQARAALERYGRFAQRSDEALNRIGATTRSERNKARVASAVQARQTLLAVRARVLERPQVLQRDSLQEGLSKELESALNDYLDRLHVLYDAESRSVEAGIGDALSKTLRARALIAVSSVLALLAVLQQVRARLREARESVARKDREIDALQQQRDGLVREVHHRIKNHLQGLLALIDSSVAADPLAARSLNTLQGHVLALINVHGLQAAPGKAQGGQVSLNELMARQLPLIEASFPRATVTLGVAAGTNVMIKGDHAMPLALAVTELIVNGLKHGAGTQVAVEVSSAQDGTEIVVSHAVDAAPAFDWGRGTGLGTGLQLVATLLLGIGRVVQDNSREGELKMAIRLDTEAR
jgi:two-component sensor histidine kinase